VGGQMVQEGGLVDAGFPAYQEDSAPAASYFGHQIVHDLGFTIASEYHAHPAPRERHRQGIDLDEPTPERVG
jgi:hypothetical protein